MLPPDQLKGRLEFSGVSFAYPTRKEAPIFQDLSLLVPAGTIMAVVGSSGSGKSTLVSMLLRLYDPDAGENKRLFSGCSFINEMMMIFYRYQIFSFLLGQITIDGHDIRSLNPYWLRSHIGTVSQVTLMFNLFLFLYISFHSTHINLSHASQFAPGAKKRGSQVSCSPPPPFSTSLPGASAVFMFYQR